LSTIPPSPESGGNQSPVGKPLQIVAGGGERLRRARGYAEARRRIQAEVKRSHGEERKHVSIWGRLRLELRIFWEVRARLRKEFPPDALYWALPLYKRSRR